MVRSFDRLRMSGCIKRRGLPCRWLGGYGYLVTDCLFQLPDLFHFGVFAALGLAVEEGLAVQVDLQAAIVYRCDGYGKLASKLCEELSRYPSG